MHRVAYWKPNRTKKKYNAQTTEYNGRRYHSKKEAQYAEELDWRKKGGEIQSWKPQHKIDIKVNGIHICNYYVDFRVVLADGTIQYHEVKGVITEVWRLKWKLVEALKDELLEPGCELIVIK